MFMLAGGDPVSLKLRRDMPAFAELRRDKRTRDFWVVQVQKERILRGSCD
ncbi:MAG: hypothetical protein JXD22_03995 [Sedimentisphaerales bacterium]|nr:hypothetical protein [Sedimentisphaerales bacterium]